MIEILQSIEGNPEIKIYNGYVEDFMNVGNISKTKIHKMSRKKKCHFVNLDNTSKGLPKVNENSIKADTFELIPEDFDDLHVGIILIEPTVRNIVLHGCDRRYDLPY